MANTQPAQLSFSIQDELGVRATSLYPAMVDPAMTVAQLVTNTTALGGLLDAIIEGQIITARASIDLGPQGAKSAPGADSRVEETGVFNFSDVVTTYRYALAVPSFLDSKLDGSRINLADTDVSDYITWITAAMVGGGRVTNHNRQVLSALRDAFLSTRKHRRALNRSTFTTP